MAFQPFARQPCIASSSTSKIETWPNRFWRREAWRRSGLASKVIPLTRKRSRRDQVWFVSEPFRLGFYNHNVWVKWWSTNSQFCSTWNHTFLWDILAWGRMSNPCWKGARVRPVITPPCGTTHHHYSGGRKPRVMKLLCTIWGPFMHLGSWENKVVRPLWFDHWVNSLFVRRNLSQAVGWKISRVAAMQDCPSVWLGLRCLLKIKFP